MTATGPTRTPVIADDAPGAIGPYNQAIRHGDLLWCSGQIPLDPASGELVGDTPAAQTIRCLENLAAVCAAAGTQLENAVRVSVYTTQLDRFAEINEAYGAFFRGVPPARVTIGVAALPKGASVEIDAVVAVT